MRLGWVILFLTLWALSVTADAFRISKPAVFSLPWTQDQVNQLNDTLDKIWNLQLGEFNADIVETSKVQADNGDFWFIMTPPVVRIQIKANNQIYTFTPDGY